VRGVSDRRADVAVTMSIRRLASAIADPSRRTVDVHADGTTFSVRVRLDTAREVDYYRHGGVMPYVLRTILNTRDTSGAQRRTKDSEE
jgi:aconitase A